MKKLLIWNYETTNITNGFSEIDTECSLVDNERGIQEIISIIKDDFLYINGDTVKKLIDIKIFDLVNGQSVG